MRLFLFLMASMSLFAETKVVPLDSTMGLKLVNVTAQHVTYKGKQGLRVGEPPNNKADIVDQLVVLPVDFSNGTIELELAGSVAQNANAGARGFVGVAFRVESDLKKDVKKFECIYLRPTNPRSDDQVRRNHSVQYISFPDYPWQRLRKDNRKNTNRTWIWCLASGLS